MRIHIKDIPQEMIDKHNLTDKVAPDGFVYIKIQGAMYVVWPRTERMTSKQGTRNTPGL